MCRPSKAMRALDAPPPSHARITAVMRGNKRSGTRPERAVRSALHNAGMRFRVDHLVRTPNRNVRPDIVFTRQQVAVFVDGCFWHGCPEHGRTPSTNEGYWQEKLRRNVLRDAAVDAALSASGWEVIRIWEHEELDRVVLQISKAVRRRSRNELRTG